MEWTEETISHLRSLWDQGLSTAEIGRRMSITKNAVVGKAHRLVLPARPSPIRKGADGEPVPARRETPRAPRRSPTPEGNRLGTQQPNRVTPFPKPASVQASISGSGFVQAAGAMNATINAPGNATVTPIRPVQGLPEGGPHSVAHPVRDLDLSSNVSSRPISSVEPRRRGLTCCWPLGEPGTKQFRFCGGEPLQGKPYCSEHSQLAYVKLRDRRDTVA